MKYFKPKSLTWWSGILSIAMGLVLLVNESHQLGEVARILAGFSGGSDASPSGMILMGTGLIGLRAKWLD